MDCGPEDALTPEGKTALSNTEYGAYVSIAREADASQVQAMSPPVLPSEAFDMEQRIQQSIYEATGANELMRGLFPDRKRTATETSEVVSASNARQSEKRNTLQEFWENIAWRILQLMQMFYDQPRMVRFVDPNYAGGGFGMYTRALSDAHFDDFFVDYTPPVFEPIDSGAPPVDGAPDGGG